MKEKTGPKLKNSGEEKILEVSDLTFEYTKGHPILQNVSFSVKPGEQIVILGENGSGKSSLLLCLLHLLERTSGNIAVKGTSLTSKTAKKIRPNMGLLFQDSNDQLFLPGVKDEIAFGPYNQGLRGQALEDRILETMGDLNLTPYLDRNVMHLSHGERKRIAFATIYAMKPDLFILDEPFVSLDPKNTHLFQKILTRLKDQGKTTLLVSHNLAHLPAFFTRAIVLSGGRIIYDGALRELYAHTELLQKANLQMPPIPTLFYILHKNGIINAPNAGDFPLPMTVDEAITQLKKILPKSKIN